MMQDNNISPSKERTGCLLWIFTRWGCLISILIALGLAFLIPYIPMLLAFGGVTDAMATDTYDSGEEGIILVSRYSGEWGIARDSSEIYTMDFPYTRLYPFQEGMARVCRSDKWGFIDKDERAVIPIIYDYVTEMQDGLIWTNIRGKWALIDKTGKQLTPRIYDRVINCHDSLSTVMLGGKELLIDHTSSIIDTLPRMQ